MGQGSLDKQGVVLVGASRRIGPATAVQGARVVLVARQEEALQRLVLGSLPGAGGDVETLVVAADVPEPSCGQTVMSRALERFGQVDDVAYAAGGNVKQRIIRSAELR